MTTLDPVTKSRSVDRILLLLLVSVIALRAYRLSDSNVFGPDLDPRPDALEYALAAESMVNGHGFTLDLEGVRYPSRYPPGFSILAAPAVAASGIAGAWWTSLAVGSLVVLACALLGRIAGGRVGLVVAGAIALLSPATLASSRLAMSETTSQLGCVAALLGATLLHWRVERPRIALFVACVAIVGFSVLVRYTNLAFAIPMVWLALRRGHDDSRGRRSFGALTAAILVFGAALAVLALRNTSLFGHPLHDGYRFWVPELYASGLTFSITYLWKPLADLFPSGNLAAYLPQLAGVSGNLWTWPVALLAVVGVGRALVLRRSCPCAATLFAASTIGAPAWVVFYSLYAWQDPRFLEPLVPLVAALGAFGVSTIVSWFGRRVAGVVTFAVLAHLAFVARPTLSPVRSPDEPAPLLESLRMGVDVLDRAGTHPDLAIIDFDPAFARHALAKETVLVVTDLESAAPHFARILDRDLHGLDGRRAEIRALTRRGEAVESAIEDVRTAVRRGETVIYFDSTREPASGPGIERLRGEFDFVEERLLPATGMLETGGPPVRAFRLLER